MSPLKEEFIWAVWTTLRDRTSAEYPSIPFSSLVEHVVGTHPQASAGAVQMALEELKLRTLVDFPEGISATAEIFRTEKAEFVRQ